MQDVTPNVVVENPAVRRWAQIILSSVGIILSSIMVLDNSTPAFDVSAWTTPAFALYGFLAATFGLAVITPNIPRHNGESVTVVKEVVVEEVTADGARG
jgi:hypothetical protein